MFLAPEGGGMEMDGRRESSKSEGIMRTLAASLAECEP